MNNHTLLALVGICLFRAVGAQAPTNNAADVCSYIDGWAMSTFSARMTQTKLALIGCEKTDLGPEYAYLGTAPSEATAEAPLCVQVSTWCEGRFAGASFDWVQVVPVNVFHYWDGNRFLTVNPLRNASRIETRFSSSARFWPHVMFGIYGTTPLTFWLSEASANGRATIAAVKKDGACSIEVWFPCESLGLTVQLVLDSEPELRIRQIDFCGLGSRIPSWTLKVAKWTTLGTRQVPVEVVDIFGLPTIPGQTKQYRGVTVERTVRIEWSPEVTCDGASMVAHAALTNSLSDDLGSFVSAAGYDVRIAQAAGELLEKHTGKAVLPKASRDAHSAIALPVDLWEGKQKPNWPPLDSELTGKLRSGWMDTAHLTQGWCAQASISMVSHLLGHPVSFAAFKTSHDAAEMSLGQAVDMARQHGVALTIAQFNELEKEAFAVVPVGKKQPYHLGVVVRLADSPDYLLWQPPAGTQVVSFNRLREACGPKAVLIPVPTR